MEWISVKDRPLYENTPNGWVATKDGDRSGGFIAALQYFDSKKKRHEWWIRHCILEDFTGLCVVGDDCNEEAGWTIDAVSHWMPLPEPPKQ